MAEISIAVKYLRITQILTFDSNDRKLCLESVVTIILGGKSNGIHRNKCYFYY